MCKVFYISKEIYLKHFSNFKTNNKLTRNEFEVNVVAQQFGCSLVIFAQHAEHSSVITRLSWCYKLVEIHQTVVTFLHVFRYVLKFVY